MYEISRKIAKLSYEEHKETYLFRQRNKFVLIPGYSREFAVFPVFLCLLHHILVRGHKIPPDVAGSFQGLPALLALRLGESIGVEDPSFSPRSHPSR